MALSDGNIEKIKEVLLKKRLNNGSLPYEPTVYEIAEQLHISPSKVRKAIAQLSAFAYVKNGYIQLNRNGNNLLNKLSEKKAQENTYAKQLQSIEIFGTIRKRDNKFVFVPNNAKRYGAYLLVNETEAKKYENHYVSGTSFEGLGGQLTSGFISKITADYGAVSSLQAKFSSIMDEHSLTRDFDEETLKEAAAIPDGSKQDILNYLRATWGEDWFNKFSAKVEDWTDVPFSSMDPTNAFNVDDAQYVKKLDSNHYLFKVAISYVGAFIRPDSNLAKVALERGFDAYFANFVCPMYPDDIAEKLSLYNDKERLALCAEFEVDLTSGYPEFKNYKICPAFIKSRHKLTYQQGEDIINNKNGARQEFALVAQGVIDGAEVAKKIKRQWKVNGFLDCEKPDPNMILSSDGEHVVDIINDNGTLAHKYVECSMLGYNIVFAKYATENELDIIYRVEEDMFEEKAVELEEISVSMNLPYYETLNDLIDSAREIDIDNSNSIVANCKNCSYVNLYPFASAVSSLVVMRQNKAKYSETNIGHSATTLEEYSHVSAPVRRVTDCVNQWNYLDHILGTNCGYDSKNLQAMCQHFNEREESIAIAERDQLQACAVKWASEHLVDEIVDAIIIMLNNDVVTLQWNFLNITVPVSSLSEVGEFQLMNYNSALVNNKTKEAYKIGQKLKIKLENFDVSTAVVSGTIANKKKEVKKELSSVDAKILGL